MMGQDGLAAGAAIRIVLADDRRWCAPGCGSCSMREDGFEVVAEAGDVDAATRYVRGHQPRVLVLDLNMPGGSSLEAIPRSARSRPTRRSSC